MSEKVVDELTLFRSKNKNEDFTLIARDCVGGILYHQLGLKFLTPTINLFFTPDDFNYFCLYLKDYIEGTLKEDFNSGVNYPVGILTPRESSKIDKAIKIGFMHYDSYKEAEKKWYERKKRINYDNLYVVNTFCYPVEIASLNDELIKNWNKIKYPKIVITDKKYGFKNEFIIDKPQECEEYAWLLFAPDKSNPWKRTFNEFDFIKFLNRNSFLRRIKRFFKKNK